MISLNKEQHCSIIALALAIQNIDGWVVSRRRFYLNKLWQVLEGSYCSFENVLKMTRKTNNHLNQLKAAARVTKNNRNLIIKKKE